MTRRPKLSLAQDRVLDKQQALDFDINQQAGAKRPLEFENSAPEFAEAKPSPEPIQPEQLVARESRNSRQPGSGWRNRRLLAKAMVAVVTVALSIYLLKRRVL